MYPQKRNSRHPLLQFGAFKEPRGRSLMLYIALKVVICGRVRRRKPFWDVLFYLCPWVEDSVSTKDTIRVGGYRHCTSSILFDIWLTAVLVLLAPEWTSI